jgi:pimeloyl-ACP methyl ester carboxylesterase
VEPETRYARSGDVSIAYQVIGDGPFDVVRIPPFVSHVELDWQIPHIAEFIRQLSSFCRLIRFDKRGTGMSDRVSDVRRIPAGLGVDRALAGGGGGHRAKRGRGEQGGADQDAPQRCKSGSGVWR